MAKKRTTRMMGNSPQQPPAASLADERGQPQTSPDSQTSEDSIRAAIMRQAEIENAARARALQLHTAPPIAARPEPETTMLTTENMPGIIEPAPPPLIQPIPPAQDVREVAEYRGDEIGAQVRDVELTRGYAPVVRLAITFEPDANYIIEFITGRARVPQRIADYIQRENPGGCMRIV